MSKSHKNINGSRLKATFKVSSGIGATEGGGLTRLPLSKEDKEMRDVFIGWLREAGLRVRIDDMGNIYGRREGKNKNAGAVLIGSHLDTQPKGGKFDGILGVLSALEVIRTLNDHNVKTQRPIEIVNFTAEEGGRFGIPMASSGVLAGKYTKDFIYSLKDENGNTFGQSLENIGYKGDVQNRLTNHNIHCFIETHIEQSPTLYRNEKSIGVVEGIEGVTNLKAIVEGQSSHSVFPSIDRRDALLAASEMIVALNDTKEQFDDLNPWTGIFEVFPSKPTITPGKVEFNFGVKHYEDGIRKKAIKYIKEQFHHIAEKRNVLVEIEDFWEMTSTKFSDEIINLVEEGARHHGYSYQKILSPAGHDARYMNELVKTGMIFAPSVDGLSHCEEEFTSFEDIEKVTNVLLYVVESLAT